MKYTFASRNGKIVTVEALTEANARRLAMIKCYGEDPDKITPHAPKYDGAGLIQVRS
jgi:hypothetical protein